MNFKIIVKLILILGLIYLMYICYQSPENFSSDLSSNNGPLIITDASDPSKKFVFIYYSQLNDDIQTDLQKYYLTLNNPFFNTEPIENFSDIQKRKFIKYPIFLIDKTKYETYTKPMPTPLIQDVSKISLVEDIAPLYMLQSTITDDVDSTNKVIHWDSNLNMFYYSIIAPNDKTILDIKINSIDNKNIGEFVPNNYINIINPDIITNFSYYGLSSTISSNKFKIEILSEHEPN